MSNRLPNDLINSLKGQPEFDIEAFVRKHDTEEKTNSIRLNPAKPFDHTNLQIASGIPWCAEGYYLSERPVFTLDPFFHAGCYYSQEASSMFLAHAIDKLGLNRDAVKALDLCAAPGGKSTLLHSNLHPDSLLISNEIIKSRANILADNLLRWGHSNVVVTNNDPAAFKSLPGYFDLLVVDAPCSGSGMFHKDHNAIDEWSLANVKLCSERQRRILAETVESLSEGGYLFYSTCSYSIEENEEIVDWLIENYGFKSIAIPTEEEWGIQETDSMIYNAKSYRFYPHKVGGEGFFFTVLKKESASPGFSFKRLKQDKNTAPQHLAKDWMNMDGLFTFQHQDNLHVFPKGYELDLKALQSVLYLKNAGTNIGKLTGKELIPTHDLAMSMHIKPDIPNLEVDLDTALSFLRKDTLPAEINPDNLKGWLLIRYEGVNLGWIKAMPNRINNYYPKTMRIAVL